MDQFDCFIEGRAGCVLVNRLLTVSKNRLLLREVEGVTTISGFIFRWGIFAISAICVPIGAIRLPANPGIGENGTTSVAKVKGFGANLKDNLRLRWIFKVHGVNRLNTMASSLSGKAKIGAGSVLLRSGPMATGVWQCGDFGTCRSLRREYFWPNESQLRASPSLNKGGGARFHLARSLALQPVPQGYILKSSLNLP